MHGQSRHLPAAEGASGVVVIAIATPIEGWVGRVELDRTGAALGSIPSVVYGEPVTAAEAIVVGDTEHDVAGAHAAGIACVGVGSHNFSVEQLCEAGADYAIEALSEGLPL